MCWEKKSFCSPALILEITAEWNISKLNHWMLTDILIFQLVCLSSNLLLLLSCWTYLIIFNYHRSHFKWGIWLSVSVCHLCLVFHEHVRGNVVLQSCLVRFSSPFSQSDFVPVEVTFLYIFGRVFHADSKYFLLVMNFKRIPQMWSIYATCYLLVKKMSIKLWKPTCALIKLLIRKCFTTAY